MDSDPEPQNPDTATLLVDWPAESEHPLRCAFVYSESEARCPPSLLGLLHQEFIARQREELNMLYVAMTRARQRLVFSATEPFRRAAGVSWWQRVEALAQTWSPAPATAPVGFVGEMEPFSLAVLPAWSGTALPAPTPRPASAPPVAATDSTRLGSAVHRVLEWASRRRGNSAPEALAMLPALAEAAAREFGAPTNEVLRIAQRIWQSPACAPFFDPRRQRWAGNEVPVSDGGDTLRLDRLVALEEGDTGSPQTVWWVLDYKLEHRPEALAPYREQLLRYRRAVARLQPGEQVRCAFITGAGELVEID
jgi:ATP-dependent helicase/nuclease subunit A